MARDRLQTFPWRLFWRFVTGQLLIMTVILAIAGVSARGIFRNWFIQQAADQARSMLDTVVRADPKLIAERPAEWCSIHSGEEFAVALVEKSGRTLCNTMEGDLPGDLSDVEGALRDGFATQVYANRDLEGSPALLASMRVGNTDRVARARLPLEQLRDALKFLDGTLALVLVGLAVVFGGFSLWMGRRLMFPLGRLLVKARQVGGEGGPQGFQDEEELVGEQEQGEWLDLESTLDQIRSNLKSKTESLSREREELATLMAALSDAIVAVDREGNPLFYNSRYALVFGSGRLGEAFRAPEVLNAFRKALDEGKTQEASATLHIQQDAVPRHFALSVAPLRKDGGDIYGAVGIFHDVTELKRAEQIRIEFVANVSHELRTPLTSIKGYTDTLVIDARSGRFDSTLQFLETISRNVDRLMALIGDLLDLSSLESGDGELTKSAVSTRELTERVLAQVESLRAAKAHAIDARYDASVVYAQPEKLEQVLTNLLVNAIKYVPAGGRIQVRWESKAKGVLLHVADNGPGIPPEHQPRLFERFYRIDKARSRELGGTGLGLAIVKHILQSHGGTVYVVSEPGKGAEFVCQFPNA